MQKTSLPILICDDEKNMRRMLKDVLAGEGYAVECAENGKEALKLIEDNNGNYSLLITDLTMPEMDGFKLIENLRKLGFGISVIVITAYATIETAVQTMRSGAVDFIVKPFGIEQIKTAVRRSLDSQTLLKHASFSKPKMPGNNEPEHNIIGSDDRLKQIFSLISRVSNLDTSVLIQGESGTGKELVAQAIHYNGNRKDHPFVAVNCGALPESLLESEFFGHERGAFTGAHALQKGKFELANGGTLFLDEIGEMPLELQVKLLRVLQEKKIVRVGGEKEIKVDVRIIAATNRDLSTDVDEKLFRQDLFYRLNVISIEIPPLRERRSDIPELVHHFLEMFTTKHQLDKVEISDEQMIKIQNRSWRGNIRELQNSAEKAVILGSVEALISDSPTGRQSSELVQTSALSHTNSLDESSHDSNLLNLLQLSLGTGEEIRDLKLVSEDAERMAIVRALKVCANNKAEASKRLGVSRKTLFNKINELNIRELLENLDDTPLPASSDTDQNG
ncbi:MAG: sigma-54-dependent transcriptional regulator [Sumerlaeia bacterium]